MLPWTPGACCLCPSLFKSATIYSSIQQQKNTIRLYTCAQLINPCAGRKKPRNMDSTKYHVFLGKKGGSPPNLKDLTLHDPPSFRRVPKSGINARRTAQFACLKQFSGAPEFKTLAFYTTNHQERIAWCGISPGVASWHVDNRPWSNDAIGDESRRSQVGRMREWMLSEALAVEMLQT